MTGKDGEKAPPTRKKQQQRKNKQNTNNKQTKTTCLRFQEVVQQLQFCVPFLQKRQTEKKDKIDICITFAIAQLFQAQVQFSALLSLQVFSQIPLRVSFFQHVALLQNSDHSQNNKFQTFTLKTFASLRASLSMLLLQPLHFAELLFAYST